MGEFRLAPDTPGVPAVEPDVGTDRTLDLTPRDAIPDAVDMTAPPERGNPEVSEARVGELTAATVADLAALTARRGPYREWDPITQGYTCHHLTEARALTDRTRDLAALAVGEAVEVVETGVELTAEYLERHRSDPWADCSAVCEDDRLDQLTEVAVSPKNTGILMKDAIDRGRERRPVPLEGEHEALAEIVDAVSVDTYFTYSRVSGLFRESIREQPGSCMQGAYLLQQQLRTIGLETQVMQYTKPPFFSHFFLRMHVGDSEPLYIDPTWQQFMPAGSDLNRLPHVLIVPKSRITEAAGLLGVRGEDTGVWSNGKLCSTNWREYCSISFGTIMQADGELNSPRDMLPSLRVLLQAARR